MTDRYAYRAIGSDEDSTHVGLCALIPALAVVASVILTALPVRSETPPPPSALRRAALEHVIALSRASGPLPSHYEEKAAGALWLIETEMLIEEGRRSEALARQPPFERAYLRAAVARFFARAGDTAAAVAWLDASMKYYDGDQRLALAAIHATLRGDTERADEAWLVHLRSAPLEELAGFVVSDAPWWHLEFHGVEEAEIWAALSVEKPLVSTLVERAWHSIGSIIRPGETMVLPARPSPGRHLTLQLPGYSETELAKFVPPRLPGSSGIGMVPKIHVRIESADLHFACLALGHMIEILPGLSGAKDILVTIPIPDFVPVGPCAIELAGRRIAVELAAEPEVVIFSPLWLWNAAGEKESFRAAGLPVRELMISDAGTLDPAVFNRCGERESNIAFCADGEYVITDTVPYLLEFDAPKHVPLVLNASGRSYLLEADYSENWLEVELPAELDAETFTLRALEKGPPFVCRPQPYPSVALNTTLRLIEKREVGGERRHLIDRIEVARSGWLDLPFQQDGRQVLFLMREEGAVTLADAETVDGWELEDDERNPLRRVRHLRLDTPESVPNGEYTAVLASRVGRYLVLQHWIPSFRIVDQAELGISVRRIASHHHMSFFQGDKLKARFSFQPGDLVVTSPELTAGGTAVIRAPGAVPPREWSVSIETAGIAIVRTGAAPVGGTVEVRLSGADRWLAAQVAGDTGALSGEARLCVRPRLDQRLEGAAAAAQTAVTPLAAAADRFVAAFGRPAASIYELEGWLIRRTEERPGLAWGDSGALDYVATTGHRSFNVHAFDSTGLLILSLHTGGINNGPFDYARVGRTGEVIGRTDENLLWTPPWESNALGHLVADAIRAAADAEIGLFNALGLRGNIPRGKIREGHIGHALPFRTNRVVTLDLAGRDLLSLLFGALDRRFLFPSGLTLTHNFRLGIPRLEVRIGDVELDPDRIYRVAVPDYLARGGDGFTIPDHVGPGRDVGLTVVEAVIRYLKTRPDWTPDRRIRVVAE